MRSLELHRVHFKAQCMLQSIISLSQTTNKKSDTFNTPAAIFSFVLRNIGPGIGPAPSGRERHRAASRSANKGGRGCVPCGTLQRGFARTFGLEQNKITHNTGKGGKKKGRGSLKRGACPQCLIKHRFPGPRGFSLVLTNYRRINGGSPVDVSLLVFARARVVAPCASFLLRAARAARACAACD